MIDAANPSTDAPDAVLIGAGPAGLTAVHPRSDAPASMRRGTGRDAS